MERQDLVEVFWQLDGEVTGSVAAYWQEMDKRWVHRRLVTDRSVDWAELPSPVAWIIHHIGLSVP